VIEENGRRKHVVPTPLSGIRDDGDQTIQTPLLLTNINIVVCRGRLVSVWN
jgi:hypothetical protein